MMPDSDVTFTSEWKSTSLFNIDDTGTCLGFSDYYKSLGDAAPTDIMIPEGVIRIGNMLSPAFKGTNITSVVLPKTIERISAKAFAECRSLRSITFPEVISRIAIEVLAFSYCSSLESVELPAGTELVGSSIFSNCTNLHTVILPSTLSEIIGSLFDRCSALSNIVIPEGVTDISGHAFRSCTSLYSMTIPNSMERIYWNAFDGCTSLTSININKPANSIAGAPWSAPNATVNWLG